MSRLTITDQDLANFAVTPVSIEPDTIELSHTVFLRLVAEIRERRALDEHRRASDEELIRRRHADLTAEDVVLTVGERERWRRMFDARTAGPWAHEPGTGVVISVTYRRPVCTADEWNADFIAQAFDGWPRTLDALELAEKERDDARNELESVLACHLEVDEDAKTLENMLRSSYETCRIAVRDRDECNQASQALGVELDATKQRVLELERMLAAFMKHRHTPSLVADWARYQKENP